MLEVNDFDAVRISLASPEQIRSWSYGEVTKPETINYRTLKPERDGLFCERIFGPTKDFECFCGKYKKIRYKGIICDKCGVEVARAKVRRERMGHIELACPVSHIWFAKGVPSRLGLLLDLSPRNLDRVLYFSHYIITDINEEVRQTEIRKMETELEEELTRRQIEVETKIQELESQDAPIEEINQIRGDFSEEEISIKEKYTTGIEQLKSLHVKELLTENQYAELSQKYGEIFAAGMGAESILKITKTINIEEMRNNLIQETFSASGQRRKKASKQLQVIESFRRSGNKPEWMIITILPVLPPDLRPMVQLDGGRFATSDLNDLYRRVINRNNRLRHLMDIGAPEIIIRNEKRMLQEAVDSLIDNGRRGRAVSVSGNHKLKSLSDMLRGKQGRFRQNLLGKRVDYSGRSVIVVGPELKLHQCGLPRRMALELFKPFVMRYLVQKDLAHNIKSARRLVERARPEVYDILEEVIKERPVMINRAPSLHRLSVQAFEPVLIEGNAIQIHPLVCSAFNADFDGDQMAVHVPLSKEAVAEARNLMLSVNNMLLPSSGEPVVTPTLDMVLGSYYLTTIRPNSKGEGKIFSSFEDARMAYELGVIDLRAEVIVRDMEHEGQRIKTSVGRIIFNEAMPEELDYINKIVDKSRLKQIVAECYKKVKNKGTAVVLDNIKKLGFHYATTSGITIAASDIEVPEAKHELLKEAEAKTTTLENQYRQGLITEDERYTGVVEVWTEIADRLTDVLIQSMDRSGSIYMMSTSGAKGNISQIKQMAGMRGLMTSPSGKIIDFPIKSSLREGLSVLEYFISTHGARKGLADTALRTSSSGYLTRRLIDVAQDVITREEDCGTKEGIWIFESKDKNLLPPLTKRISGRMAAQDVINPETGETIVKRNEEIDEDIAAEIVNCGITKVYVRSPLSCASRFGVCRMCYGRDLARGSFVDPNTAVGIIAAQSIGEPGTQLTLRTFHTGGIIGLDITTGLPRVEELFEARTPKAQALITEISGVIEIMQDEEGRKIKITNAETLADEYDLPEGWQIMVEEGQPVEAAAILASEVPDADKNTSAAKEETAAEVANPSIIAQRGGTIMLSDRKIKIYYEEKEEREYVVPAAAQIRVKNGDHVETGTQLTEGSLNPQDLMRILGRNAVQQYMVEEVQKVYRSQGVNINDKHIEIITRQMLTQVRITSSGDTKLVPGEIVDRFYYEDTNAKVLAEGGEPATALPILLGITRASLNTDSWLAAASFQETTRVLTEAAVNGKIDRLIGLKENVIIGKLIPAHNPAMDTMQEENADDRIPVAAGPSMIADEVSEKERSESEEDHNSETDESLIEDHLEEDHNDQEDEEEQLKE
jgi:DNA-directed RNA polymerase subunit beta'